MGWFKDLFTSSKQQQRQADELRRQQNATERAERLRQAAREAQRQRQRNATKPVTRDSKSSPVFYSVSQGGYGYFNSTGMWVAVANVESAPREEEDVKAPLTDDSISTSYTPYNDYNDDSSKTKYDYNPGPSYTDDSATRSSSYSSYGSDSGSSSSYGSDSSSSSSSYDSGGSSGGSDF